MKFLFDKMSSQSNVDSLDIDTIVIFIKILISKMIFKLSKCKRKRGRTEKSNEYSLNTRCRIKMKINQGFIAFKSSQT